MSVDGGIVGSSGGGGTSSGSAADSVPSSPAQGPVDAAAGARPPPSPAAPGSQLQPETLQQLLRYLGSLAHAAGRAWAVALVPQVGGLLCLACKSTTVLQLLRWRLCTAISVRLG
jgi:hypothetical protein